MTVQTHSLTSEKNRKVKGVVGKASGRQDDLTAHREICYNTHCHEQ